MTTTFCHIQIIVLGQKTNLFFYVQEDGPQQAMSYYAPLEGLRGDAHKIRSISGRIALRDVDKLGAPREVSEETRRLEEEIKALRAESMMKGEEARIALAAIEKKEHDDVGGDDVEDVGGGDIEDVGGGDVEDIVEDIGGGEKVTLPPSTQAPMRGWVMVLLLAITAVVLVVTIIVAGVSYSRRRRAQSQKTNEKRRRD